MPRRYPAPRKPALPLPPAGPLLAIALPLLVVLATWQGLAPLLAYVQATLALPLP